MGTRRARGVGGGQGTGKTRGNVGAGATRWEVWLPWMDAISSGLKRTSREQWEGQTHSALGRGRGRLGLGGCRIRTQYLGWHL